MGINLLLWVTALSFSLVAVAQWNHLRLTGGGRWLSGPAVIFAALFALRDSILLNSANLLAILICLALMAYRARQGRIRVAALALPCLLFMHWLLKKEDPRPERLFRLLSGSAIALLSVIMFSAAYRMRLYQIEFGLTELRLYTTAFMGWLAIVLAWFVITVGRGQANRFAFGALASACGVLLILNALNPDDFIVRVNAGRVVAANPLDTITWRASPPTPCPR